ncbi:MAG: energy-coupling factor ABC transporter substrate-binding protein [Candidatus Accumulibacter sp.]|jgi:cobalt/nickel transport protein|nr:energy-coupling factor ABC transporter substrate-binding protein [Accumulibacter sp.]
MRRYQNLWLALGVVLLAVLPLWIAPAFLPATGEVALFEGADGKAMELIGKISPEYRPWFSPLIEPMSGEIASLLFSFQAALGAGVIGYYLGAARMRDKLRREHEAAAGTSENNGNPEKNAPPCVEKAGTRRAD